MAVETVIGTRMVDLANDTNYVFALVPQGDGQERLFDINVFQNGTPYTLPQDAQITIDGQNPAGITIKNTCSITGTNTIRVPLTGGIMSYGGAGKYNITIKSGGKYIKSFPFNIIVVDGKHTGSGGGESDAGGSGDSYDNSVTFTSVLHPGNTSVTINGTAGMFSAEDAKGNRYDYYVRFLFSNNNTKLAYSPAVVIGDSSISTTIAFDDNILDIMAVSPSGSENPSNEGWYVASGSTYVPTTDTTVVSGRTYYADIIIVLEVIKNVRTGWHDGGAPMYPFATATNAQLAAMLDSYYYGDYTPEQVAELKTTYLPIGAKRRIHINAMEAIGVEDSHIAADYDFIIIGHEHDDLLNPINGKTKALLTLHQERILFNDTSATTYSTNYPSIEEGGGYINKPNTNKYSWIGTQRRTWCNEVYYNALPTYIKDMIKPVVKLTSAGNLSLDIISSIDKVFILSITEIGVDNPTAYFPNEGERYPYFYDNNNILKSPIYSGGGSKSAYWWSRSPYIGTVTESGSTSFRCIINTGSIARGTSASSMGIAPSFCI